LVWISSPRRWRGSEGKQITAIEATSTGFRFRVNSYELGDYIALTLFRASQFAEGAAIDAAPIQRTVDEARETTVGDRDKKIFIAAGGNDM
jgi:hypothetical protein